MQTQQLVTALEAYRRYDPAGWVGIYRQVPIWAGGIAVVLGVLMLLFGSGRLFRLVAGPMGAAVGFLWAELLAGKFGFASQAKQIGVAATVGLGALGLVFPPGAVFFIFGVPAGLIAGELAGSTDWLLGFFPGFIVGGVLAMAAHRSIGAVASSLFGGALAVVGVLAVLAPSGVSGRLAAQPWGVLGAAALLAVGGVVYQLFVRMSPDERAAQSEEKRRAKKRANEKAALEKRWSNYTKNKGD